MQTAYMCDMGMVRKLNEDSLAGTSFVWQFSGSHREGGLYIVADGMGGHNAGEVASEWG